MNSQVKSIAGEQEESRAFMRELQQMLLHHAAGF
jgi:hypothetical protein